MKSSSSNSMGSLYANLAAMSAMIFIFAEVSFSARAGMPLVVAQKPLSSNISVASLNVFMARENLWSFAARPGASCSVLMLKASITSPALNRLTRPWVPDRAMVRRRTPCLVVM